MKRSIWTRVPTLHYQTRNMPCKTLNKLTAMQGMLGRNVSKEMVFAMALEYGMEMMERYYVGAEDHQGLFMRDFRLLFGEEKLEAVEADE